MEEQNVGLLIANSHLRFRYCSCCGAGVFDDYDRIVETYDAAPLDYLTATAAEADGGLFVELRQYKPHWLMYAASVLHVEDEDSIYLRLHCCELPKITSHVSVEALYNLAKLDRFGRPVIAKVPSRTTVREDAQPTVEQLELFA